MASVTKRGDIWGFDYYDLGRKRHFIQAKPNTRKAADALGAEIIKQLGLGIHIAPNDQQTFDDMVNAYRVGHLAADVRDTTAKWYEGALRNHLTPYFTGWKLQQIRARHIEQFRADMVAKGKGVRTINKCLSLLGAMFRYAIKHDMMVMNPAALVPKLREEHGQKQDARELNILMPAEINAMVEAADDRYRLLLMTAVSTGLRQGELLGLQWGDIDWQAKQIHVRRSWSGGRMSEPKTKTSRRKVSIFPGLLTELRAWRLRCPKGNLDLVFPNGDGKPQQPSNLLRRGFFPALRRAGLRRIRFHDLRHTFASLLIHRNVNPKIVSTLMGHSSIKVTLDVYGHLFPNVTDGVTDDLGAFVFNTETAESGKQMVSKAQVRTAEVLKIA